MDADQLKTILREMNLQIQEQRVQDVEELKNQRTADMKCMERMMQNMIDSMNQGPNLEKKVQIVQTTGPEIVINSLAPHIDEFIYDVENNLTFDTWFARYEDTFVIDAKELDDAGRTRLLLRRLSTPVHAKYIDYILPKTPKDFNFDQTVEKLKAIFGRKTSKFNQRYNCLQLVKESSADFITYTSVVNKQCELFDFNGLSLEQFKCLIFVMGLKSSTDSEIRSKLLNMMDTKEAEITLEKISTECQRLINLKKDTALIDTKKSEPQINRLHASKAGNKTNSNSNKKSGEPKTPCWFCGNMHFSKECTFTNHKCSECGNVGHKNGYCGPSKIKSKSDDKSNSSSDGNKGSHKRKSKKTKPKANESAQSNAIFTTNNISASNRKYIQVAINGHKLELQFDTASDITIISEENFAKLKARNAAQVTHTARGASGQSLPLSVQFECDIEFKGKHASGMCFVTSTKNLNVLGIDWIEKLQLWDQPISALCNKVHGNMGSIDLPLNVQNIAQLKASFPAVFDSSLGLCNKTKAKLCVKPESVPVFRPKRPVAYAMQSIVENEIQRLLDSNVISPVNYSDWAAPIVVIKKTKGSIRLCADFSTGLNDALEQHQYPLPLPDDIFARMSTARVFSHIDLSDAFLQVEVDDDSKHLLTINTHKGLFRYNRMAFGVKIFPAIFQQIMDEMLAGLSFVAAYIDDIFVAGRNQQEHDKNLREVLHRIQDFGFKLKFEKCKFSVTEIKYLGFIINQHGLQPDARRVAAISNMPQPSNVPELRSFLGAVNFYGKFVSNMRRHRGPLDELLHKDVKWQWSNQHVQCFTKLKEILCSGLLLTHYNPERDIIVAADASNYGLGAVILHEFDDGSVKAIYHASRSLTSAEKAYSQIEKEGLALIFAVTKFHKMIFGRKFKLHTDHKPLLAIFGRKTGIAVHQANRLQRWAITLLQYDFDISYVSTNSFGYADVLSRLMQDQKQEEEDFVIASIKFEAEINQILADAFDNLPVTHKMVRAETEKDPILQQIMKFVKEGWPQSTEDDDLKPCINRQLDISIIEGCLMYGDRVIIPKVLQKRILKQLHKGHPGIERTKSIARSFVYWHRIDSDVESFVRNCNNCASAAKMPTKTTLEPWPTSSSPWDRIHIDYAGPIDGNYFLVVVDSYSKWPEIIATKSITTQRTMDILIEIFARFGVPKTIVSDNGTQFTSSEFQKFVELNGITHLRSSPYYPMSNGQAERFVDTFKRALKKLDGEGTSTRNLQTFLQCYRSTPNKQVEDGKSPAEALMGRKIRIQLDLLKPVVFSGDVKQNEKMQQQFNEKHGAKEIHYNVKELVFARVHNNNNNGFDWKPGVVIERFGKVMYNVLLDEEKLIRSHTNQLRRRYSHLSDPLIDSKKSSHALIETFDLSGSAQRDDSPTALRRSSRQRMNTTFFQS